MWSRFKTHISCPISRSFMALPQKLLGFYGNYPFKSNAITFFSGFSFQTCNYREKKKEQKCVFYFLCILRNRCNASVSSKYWENFVQRYGIMRKNIFWTFLRTPYVSKLNSSQNFVRTHFKVISDISCAFQSWRFKIILNIRKIDKFYLNKSIWRLLDRFLI